MTSIIQTYWERFAIYVSSILLVVGAWQWQDHHNRLQELENKIHKLEIEKVSKQELIAFEDRIDRRMEDVKKGIIDRMDWYFIGKDNADRDKKR